MEDFIVWREVDEKVLESTSQYREWKRMVGRICKNTMDTSRIGKRLHRISVGV